MHPAETFRQSLLRLLEILSRHEVRFHLTGGIASVAYGEPRMTQDIDIVVDNPSMARATDAFLREAEAAGFMVDAASARRAIADRSMFQAYDMNEALKFDLYPRELIPGELGRSTLLEVFGGVRLPVVSRPDAAASKLIWSSKGSHKSRRDLRHMTRSMTGAERAELVGFARARGLDGLLDEILGEPDEISG
jgi:hypothetical protein